MPKEDISTALARIIFQGDRTVVRGMVYWHSNGAIPTLQLVALTGQKDCLYVFGVNDYTREGNVFVRKYLNHEQWPAGKFFTRARCSTEGVSWYDAWELPCETVITSCHFEGGASSLIRDQPDRQSASRIRVLMELALLQHHIETHDLGDTLSMEEKFFLVEKVRRIIQGWLNTAHNQLGPDFPVR